MTGITNVLKERLAKKERVAGAWLWSASPLIASLFADAGFDFVLIDMEHSPVDIAMLPVLINALRGSGCAAVVRPPWNDTVTIKRVLDCGASCVHVPFVRSPEEARAAVQNCKYPPEGVRGVAGVTNATRFGLVKNEYLSTANRSLLVMPAIEDLDGAACAREIALTEGVDGVFIGPSDLSAAQGSLIERPAETESVIAQIEAQVLPTRKFLGTFARSVQEANALYARGYSFMIVLSDMGTLANVSSACLNSLDIH